MKHLLEEAKYSPNYTYYGTNLYKYIFSTIKDVHKTYVGKLGAIKQDYENRNDVVVECIHDMKTSVSVIKLATESGMEKYSEEILIDILSENDKLQKNLEGTLNLFRLDKFSKDYIPERISLKDLVHYSINRLKPLFIYNNVFPKVKIEENLNIYTDKKWASYVIEQITINSIKYSYKKNTSILFYSERNGDFIDLHIEDHGIGIKESEIGRVFEPSFTGSNGRKQEKSSGMGLYMCKIICEKLNNKININSKEGIGTEVIISYLSKL
jgi:signal transduction histidine kinase